MPRRFTQFCAAALLAGIAPAFAQTSASPTTTSPSQQQGARTGAQPNAASSDTVSGCLRRMRADATAADAKGQLYTIEVLKEDGAASDERGTPVPGTAPPTTYALTAPESVRLGKHVDHYVQLSGRLRPAVAAASPGATASGSASGTPRSTNTSSSAPGAAPGASRTFEVTGLKMLSAKCPA